MTVLVIVEVLSVQDMVALASPPYAAAGGAEASARSKAIPRATRSRRFIDIPSICSESPTIRVSQTGLFKKIRSTVTVGPLLDRVVGHRTADRERWHRAMVHDELGVVEGTRINPWLEGVQIGISFVVGGLIPTLPVLFALPQARWWAYGLTALIALVLGAIKARYTSQSPVRAGLEFLVVVTLGTLAGVGLGLLLHAG